MTLRRILALLGLACLLGLGIAIQALSSAAAEPIGQRANSTSPDRRPFMHYKLDGARHILEGLVTRDFERIASAAADMLEASKQAELASIHDDPVYQHFSIEFQRRTERLLRVAQQKNSDAAAYNYQHLTALCIDCHQHERDIARISE